MIKKFLLFLMLVIILISFYTSINELPGYIDTSSKDYFVENSVIETGSKNVVTAIYLDYRLFDSIFEASILLIVVSGVIFISQEDDRIV